MQTKVLAMQWPLLHLNGQLVSLVGLFWFWQRSWPWSGTHCSEWGHLTIFWAPTDLQVSSGKSQHPSTSSESSPSGHWVSKLSQTLESGRQVPSLQLQPGLPIMSWIQCRPFSLILAMPSSVELKKIEFVVEQKSRQNEWSSRLFGLNVNKVSRIFQKLLFCCKKKFVKLKRSSGFFA